MSYLSLLWLIFAPIVVALIIMFPKFPNHKIIVRRFAKFFATIHFIYSLLFLLFFDSSLFGMSYEKELTIFNMTWLKSLGVSAKFAVDGFSLLLVVLSVFIVMLTLYISKTHIRAKHKLYYSMVFLLEASILGLFCSKDMFMFFVFWELSLVPIYFLVAQWGNSEARRAAIKFTILSFVVNAFLFFGMLLLYYYNFAISNVLTSNIESLSMDSTFYPVWFQVMVFVSFLLAFVVRVPIFILHRWYSDIQSKSAGPVNILLSSLVLNTGLYGIIRFNMQVFPDVFKSFAPILMVWGIVGAFYAGSLALFQPCIKRIVSYSNIATMNFVLIGLATLNTTGFNGAILAMISSSLVYCGLYVVISCVQARTKTTNILELGGLGLVLPRCMYLALIIVFATIGVPFLIMFSPKLMIITGVMFASFKQSVLSITVVVLCLIALLLLSCDILYFFYKTFCSVLLEKWTKMKDLNAQEMSVLCSISLVVLYFGINPMSIVSIYQSVSSIILDVLQV